MGSSDSGDFAGFRLRTCLNLGFWLSSRKSRVGTWEVGSGVGGDRGGVNNVRVDTVLQNSETQNMLSYSIIINIIACNILLYTLQNCHIL